MALANGLRWVSLQPRPLAWSAWLVKEISALVKQRLQLLPATAVQPPGLLAGRGCAVQLRQSTGGRGAVLKVMYLTHCLHIQHIVSCHGWVRSMG